MSMGAERCSDCGGELREGACRACGRRQAPERPICQHAYPTYQHQHSCAERADYNGLCLFHAHHGADMRLWVYKRWLRKAYVPGSPYAGRSPEEVWKSLTGLCLDRQAFDQTNDRAEYEADMRAKRASLSLNGQTEALWWFDHLTGARYRPAEGGQGELVG